MRTNQPFVTNHRLGAVQDEAASALRIAALTTRIHGVICNNLMSRATKLLRQSAAARRRKLAAIPSNEPVAPVLAIRPTTDAESTCADLAALVASISEESPQHSHVTELLPGD